MIMMSTGGIEALNIRRLVKFPPKEHAIMGSWSIAPSITSPIVLQMDANGSGKSTPVS